MGDILQLAKGEVNDIHCSSPRLHFVIKATRGGTADSSHSSSRLVTVFIYVVHYLTFFIDSIILLTMKFRLTDL